MSTKSLLREFVKSGGAFAAAPKDTFVSYPIASSIGAWGNLGSFTAPSNGFVRIEASSTGEGSSFLITANDQSIGGVMFPYQGLRMTATENVAKGQVIRVSGSDLGECTMKFFATRGGGKAPQGLWRDLSCLASSLSFDRSVNSHQLSVSQAELTIESKSHLPKRRRNTSRLKTDGFVSKQLARASKQNYLDQSSSRFQTTITVLGDDVICQFAKATVSTSTFGDFRGQHRILRSSCQREDSSNLFFWEVAA